MQMREKEMVKMFIDGKFIAEREKEKIVHDGLDAWCKNSADMILFVLLKMEK
jgi:hypothetical protein